MTRIEAGYDQPVTIARGMAVAKRRTESAQSRAAMKAPEA